MNLPAGFDVGVATHTGLVRGANEDDYLVMLVPGPALLVAVADGMGGTAGGGEASRAALRGLAAALVRAPSGPAMDRLAAGYAAASGRVLELAQEVHALRDMGTTLTALLLQDGAAVLGHIGDSRAMRWRQDELTQLSVDHALRQPHNYLTRCIGGGQHHEVPDLGALPLQAGDRLVLCSDGVWSTVAQGELQSALRLPSPQAAADALVQAALRAGGPDNATALVLDQRPDLPARAVDLPRTEAVRTTGLRLVGEPLRRSWWPWLLLAASLLVATASALRFCGVFDLFAWLRRLQSG